MMLAQAYCLWPGFTEVTRGLRYENAALTLFRTSDRDDLPATSTTDLYVLKRRHFTGTVSARAGGLAQALHDALPGNKYNNKNNRRAFIIKAAVMRGAH